MSSAFHGHGNAHGGAQPHSSEPIGLAEFKVVSDEDRKPRSMEEMEKEARWLAGIFQVSTGSSASTSMSTSESICLRGCSYLESQLYAVWELRKADCHRMWSRSTRTLRRVDTLYIDHTIPHHDTTPQITSLHTTSHLTAPHIYTSYIASPSSTSTPTLEARSWLQTQLVPVPSPGSGSTIPPTHGRALA
jgi:hypothetical protein